MHAITREYVRKYPSEMCGKCTLNGKIPFPCIYSREFTDF